MFIKAKNTSIVNTDHLCNVFLRGKKIEFYFDTMTARENWDFDSEDAAKKAFEDLKEKLDVVKI